MKRNIADLIRKNIKHLKAYSSARDEFTNEALVFLDANENPYGEGLNRYPKGAHVELKTRLAQLSGIPSEQILLGNGSDEVLDLVFRTFCEPGQDNIIITPPTYGMYKVIADINDIEVREAYLNENFDLDIDSIIRLVDSNTKLLILCSPNNPSGNIMSSQLVEKLLNQLDCIVVIDEAYIEFSIAESWTNCLTEFPNLIVSQTFSKAWGLAGIRLGMGMASPFIIQTLNKVKPPYNISSLTEVQALEALQNTNQFESNRNMILKERQRLIDTFKAFPFVITIYPSDANFLLVKFADADLIYNYLMDKGVIVRNRTNEPGCSNTLRITIGTPEENNLLINILKNYKP